jgi:uncharacterized damage-inducible protein DinB
MTVMTDTTTVRLDPPYVADETPMLLSWLDFHRATLAQKTAGLTEDQLKQRAVAPSSLSLLGLVRHLADVEHYWFQQVLRGGPVAWIHRTDEDEDADFNDVADADVAQAFAAWHEQVELAREAVAGLPLDTVGQAQRHGEVVTLRWIIVHMIEEYARHNGHADLLREALDGSTGE